MLILQTKHRYLVSKRFISAMLLLTAIAFDICLRSSLAIQQTSC